MEARVINQQDAREFLQVFLLRLRPPGLNLRLAAPKAPKRRLLTPVLSAHRQPSQPSREKSRLNCRISFLAGMDIWE